MKILIPIIYAMFGLLTATSLYSTMLKSRVVEIYKSTNKRKILVEVFNNTTEPIYIVDNIYSIWIDNYYSPGYQLFGNKIRRTRIHDDDHAFDSSIARITVPTLTKLYTMDTLRFFIYFDIGQSDELMYEINYISKSRLENACNCIVDSTYSISNDNIINLDVIKLQNKTLTIPRKEPQFYVYNSSGTLISREGEYHEVYSDSLDSYLDEYLDDYLELYNQFNILSIQLSE